MSLDIWKDVPYQFELECSHCGKIITYKKILFQKKLPISLCFWIFGFKLGIQFEN